MRKGMEESSIYRLKEGKGAGAGASSLFSSSPFLSRVFSRGALTLEVAEGGNPRFTFGREDHQLNILIHLQADLCVEELTFLSALKGKVLGN